MMKKLFNKKAMIAYIIVLAITFIAGCSMIGVTVHYSNEIETLEKGDGSLESAASNVIANALSALVSGGTENSNAISDAIQNATGNKVDNDAIAKVQTKKTVVLVLMIVFFVLTAVFIAGAITAYQYPKYLESDKYRAKLKRMKKAAK
ncbi:MAG: hypothetical protein II356_02055 [Clostridia bacterium]|nr:hypothetical protein [Clostridia bacterium]